MEVKKEESENIQRESLNVDWLQIKVNFDSDESRKKGIMEVFSEWPRTKDEKIKKISIISGGITNLLYRVEVDGKLGSYLFRIYGKNTEILIDRENETKHAIEIGKQGFCPMILCVFVNGRVEQFLEAKTLEPSDMGLPKYRGVIAVKFSRMHRDLTLQTIDQKPGIRAFLEKFKGFVEQIQFKNSPKKQELFAKFDFKAIFQDMEKTLVYLEECSGTLGSADFRRNKRTEYWVRQLLLKTAAAHNDLLAGNILYTKNTRKIVFIDFEYACYNYVGFDIANHFNEYAGFDCNFRKWYPERGTQIDFFKSYWSVPGSYPKDFPIDLFNSKEFWERVIWWTDFLAYLDHYFWGLWGVCQSSISTVDFDYLTYAKSRLIDGISFHKELLSSRESDEKELKLD